jgi:hypothetical protein
MDTVFLSLAIAVSVMALVMMFRNNWVHRHRMVLIDFIFDRPAQQWFDLGRPSIDDVTGSYNSWLWKLWIWDPQKFVVRQLH